MLAIAGIRKRRHKLQRPECKNNYIPSHNTHATWCTVMAMFIIFAATGCSRDSERQLPSYLDESITKVHNMGWLGGQAHPATRVVTLPQSNESGQPAAVGGMVITQLNANSLLAEAGVIRGDVIVKIGNYWLPNKENPSMDMIRALESEVSAGVSPVKLVILRSGNVLSIELKHELEPLEIGLPAMSKRFITMADAGLEYLVKLQRPDGSFENAAGTADDIVTTCSIGGLALLAGGSDLDGGPHANALKKCRDKVEATIVAESKVLSPWSIAWATVFYAELAGPLDISMPKPTSIMNFAQGESMKLPEGIKSGQVLFSTSGELPEGFDLEKLQKSGNVQVISIGSGGGGGFAMPGRIAPVTPKSEFVDGPAWTMEDIKLKAAKGSVERLQPLSKMVERLIALQDGSGSWDKHADGRGFSEKTLTSNHVMIALGMAQRAGVPVDAKVIKNGLDHIRAKTNDGHVFAADVQGFDRRREAGRSSGAAAALNSLNCVASDEFLKELIDYSDRNAAAIPDSGFDVPLHIFNTALLRSQRGNSSWATFFEEFRYVLVSLQELDGSFSTLPNIVRGASDFDGLCQNPATRTAIWSLVAAMQLGNLPMLTANAVNPLQPRLTSDGAQIVRPSGMMGGTPIPMSNDDARKMLEGMGIDLDEVLKNSIQNPNAN